MKLQLVMITAGDRMLHLSITFLLSALFVCEGSAGFAKKYFIGNDFIDQINGITLGKIRKLESLDMNVTHAEDDLQASESLIVTNLTNIHAVSLTLGITYDIRSNSKSSLRLIDILFETSRPAITGFHQISETMLLVVDITNNCIRLLVRGDSFMTVIAGKCDKVGGYIDGKALDSRFEKPYKITEAPSISSYYIVEWKRIRILSTLQNEVTTLLIHSHEIFDAKLSPNKEFVYFVCACWLYRFVISTNSTELVAGFDGLCGRVDHHLLGSAFKSLSSLVFLNNYTILMSDNHHGNLRIVDLCSALVSTFCIPSESDTATKMFIPGSNSSCSIHEPTSLVLSKYLGAILILSYEHRPLVLPLTQDPEFECDVSHINRRVQERNDLYTKSEVRQPVFHLVQSPLVNTLNTSRDAAFSRCWVLTAAEDTKIQFNLYNILSGESIKIYDSLDQNGTLLRSFFQGSIKFGVLPDPVISPSNQMVIEHTCNPDELKSFKPIFNATYHVFGYTKEIESNKQELGETIEENIDVQYYSSVRFYGIVVFISYVLAGVVLSCIREIGDVVETIILVIAAMVGLIIHVIGGCLHYREQARDRRDFSFRNGQLSDDGDGHGDNDSDDDRDDVSDTDDGDEDADNYFDADVNQGSADYSNNLGSQGDFMQENKLEDSDSEEDGYINLKYKTAGLENNIRSDPDTAKIQEEIHANLQREDNKKINLGYKKKKVISRPKTE